jgi:hypothetical protein
MIISHKYKFIFIRPTKVASTSVEINLAKQCGEKDIITPSTKYSSSSDESKYPDLSRNYKKKGFRKHMTPKEIKKRVGPNIWNKYYKVTIVRNPYDHVVSRYWWMNTYDIIPLKKKITLKKVLKRAINPSSYKHLIRRIKDDGVRDKFKDFDYFVKNFRKRWTNTRYYFDKKGKPICDFYIRFENLEEDYKKLCKILGVPYEPLLRMKTKHRKKNMHYSEYYTNEKIKALVYKLFKREIDYFKYKIQNK